MPSLAEFRRLTALPLLTLSFITLSTSQLRAEDWPNFRGPRHDGISRESSALQNWPEKGPSERWRREIGPGFSSIAVSSGRVFSAGAENNQQVLFCLDELTGTVIWKIPVEPQMTDPDPHLHGPRATPTIDGKRAYFLGALGRLLCVSVDSGAVIWELRLNNQPHWGYSGSVLIDGDLAIIAAGGAEGSLLALDKKTGNPRWKCGEDPAGYATPYPFEFEGRRYICGFLAHSVLIAERQSGRKVLSFEYPSHSGVNVSGPIFHDGRLLISTGYGLGAGLYQLTHAAPTTQPSDEKGAAPSSETLTAEQIWKSTKLRNKFETPILIDGRLYTSDENCLKCVDFATGDVLWRKRGIVHSPLIAVADTLILLTESGELQLARASPDGFKPTAKSKLFEGSTRTLLQQITHERQGARCWTVPVLANGRIFARSHTTLVCLDFHQPDEIRPHNR